MQAWVFIVWGVSVVALLYGRSLVRQGRDDDDRGIERLGRTLRVLSTLGFPGAFLAGWLGRA